MWFLVAALIAVASFVCPTMARLTVDMSFPASIATKASSSPLTLTVPQTLAVNTSQLLVSRDVTCAAESVPAVFDGFYPGSSANPAMSYFLITPRPQWTVGPNPERSFVCVDGSVAGHLSFYTIPELNITTHPAIPLQPIPIRIFMNYGWVHEFPPIGCNGCDSRINALAFKERVSGSAPCAGRREFNNALSSIVDDDLNPIHLFPFVLSSSSEQLTFWTVSSDQLYTAGADTAGAVTKHEFAVCFYNDPSALEGTYLGNAEFVLSEDDTSALIFFLLFVGIAFPVVCIVSTLLHCHKMKLHRQWIRSVKHYVQLRQLEREMLIRPVFVDADASVTPSA